MPPEAKALGWKGFIAWKWDASWPDSFATLAANGAPTVPPILQEIVLARDPERVLEFAQRVAADFPFTTIIPAHFGVARGTTPKAWLDAFRPFGPTGTSYAGALPDRDLAFLRTFEDTLVAQGTVRPRPVPRKVQS